MSTPLIFACGPRVGRPAATGFGGNRQPPQVLDFLRLMERWAPPRHPLSKTLVISTGPYHGNCRPPVLSQHDIMDQYQLSRLVFSPLDLAIIVVPLMQCRSLQSLPGTMVHCSQSVLERCYILTHSLLLLVRPQGHPDHGLDRKSRLPTEHHHVAPVAH